MVTTTMTQTHKFLDISNHRAISDAVYDYVVNHTEILKNPVFWNWLDADGVLQHIPALAQWFENQNVKPTVMALIYVEYPAFDLTHIDEDPSLRVLWPIRNCEGSHTIFYKIDQKYFRKIFKDGATYYHLRFGAPRETIDFVELTQPVVFNPTVPHNIVLNRELDSPRLSLTIGFDNADPHSVSMDAW